MEDLGYETPRGFYDLPAIYVYNAEGLTNGTSPKRLSLPIHQDADFILRRLTGLETVAQKILPYTANLSTWATAPMRFLYDFAVVPERKYPVTSFFTFDLETVAKAVNSGGGGEVDVPYSQLVLQGVKRYKGTRPVVPESKRPYELVPFSYQTDVVVTWPYYVNPAVGGPTNIPRQYIIQVRDYDFELCQMSVCRRDGVDCSTDLKISLQDKDRTNFFTDPVVVQFLQDNNNNNRYNGVFPCPPVLYPEGSFITFYVTSLIAQSASLPITYQFSFNGMRRRWK